MDIDHVVLWVRDQKPSLEFYVETLGLEAVRAEEFGEGKVGFPSVRLNQATIFDLMDRSKLEKVQNFTGGSGDAGGSPINHVCLSMTAAEYKDLTERLTAKGVELRSGGENAFGARGYSVRSTYFCDPDGNVLEMRYY